MIQEGVAWFDGPGGCDPGYVPLRVVRDPVVPDWAAARATLDAAP